MKSCSDGSRRNPSHLFRLITRSSDRGPGWRDSTDEKTVDYLQLWIITTIIERCEEEGEREGIMAGEEGARSILRAMPMALLLMKTKVAGIDRDHTLQLAAMLILYHPEETRIPLHQLLFLSTIISEICQRREVEELETREKVRTDLCLADSVCRSPRDLVVWVVV